MLWPHSREVSPIEREHHLGLEPFGKGDDRCIGSAEGKFGVAFDQLSDSNPVVGGRSLDIDVAETAKKPRLDPRAKAAAHEVCRFRDDEGWNHQAEVGTTESRDRPGMVEVVGVDGRIERARVNDREHVPTQPESFPRHARYGGARSRRAPQTAGREPPRV